MLKKLFKYDLVSIARYWWIVAVSELVLAIGAAMALRIVLLDMESTVFEGLSGLVVILSYLVLAVSLFAILLAPLLTTVLAMVRFYKNLFSDEGYLTFTLPVSRSQILFSKLLTVSCFGAADLLLVITSVLLVLTLGSAGTSYPLLESVREALFAWTDGYGLAWVGLLVSILLFVAASGFFGTASVFLCITLGATVCKRYKVLGAIGFYYLGNLVIQLVGQVGGILVMALLGEGIADAYMAATPSGILVLTALLIGWVAMLVAALGLFLYLLTLRLLERRLNLP